MKIEKIPVEGMNGLFSINIIDEKEDYKRPKSFSEISTILSKPVKVYKGKNKGKKYTDKELLDFLQSKNEEKNYTGRCICRMSGTGRGWKIHETDRIGAKESVREAIIDAIKKEK